MTQQENIQELLRLVKENPELPIVPLVNSEVVSGYRGYEAASFGEVKIEECILTDKLIAFKHDEESFDILARQFSGTLNRVVPPKSADECRALLWKKAIVVYIETAEWEELCNT